MHNSKDQKNKTKITTQSRQEQSEYEHIPLGGNERLKDTTK